MKEVTRKSLDELANTMPIINEMSQHSMLGGGTGTRDNPYTQMEFDQMSYSGSWLGGYVEGMGYVAMQITVTPGGSYTPGSGTFVTAGDLLAEANENAQSGFWGSLVETVTGWIDGTDTVLSTFNSFGGDPKLVEYFKQNPSGQLYAIERTYQSNLGISTHQISYYNEHGTMIATRIYR